MLDRTIVKAVICLALSMFAVRARADVGDATTDEASAPLPDEARASAELSLSVAPQFLLDRALPPSGVGGLGGNPGGLGGFSLPLIIDVGLALAPETFLVVGLSGGLVEASGGASWQVNLPLSVLVYLETPRVGSVLPTLRVGGVLGWYGADFDGERVELLTGRLLVRGGVTWLAARWLALRAEIGANGGVSGALDGPSYVVGSFGFEGSLALVLRV